MLEQLRPKSIAEMPAQRASAPRTEAESRGRFFNTGNAFDVKLPPVPDHLFVDEAARALDPQTPTGLIACDLSAALECAFPATTPLVLVRYGTIKPGETLRTDLAASGVFVYVIRGTGVVLCGADRIEWSAGDVLVLSGGLPHEYQAGDAGAVLWIVSNEPQLSFEHLQAPAPGESPTDIVHYRADEIARQIDLLYEVGRDEQVAGSALIFSAERQEATRNILPTLTLAMNSLPGGVTQRPHRHNAVAVSLIVKGDRCYSTMDGRRKDWAQWATSITPPVSVHSHHNAGNEQALFLIVQDGGLYYHTRAMGFEFAEQPQ